MVAELDATKQALTSAQEALDELRSRFQLAEPSALLLGYFAGVDRKIVDQNRDESWSWVVQLDAAVLALNDPELTDLHWQHMGEGSLSPGSEEVVLRLIELTIEPILQEGKDTATRRCSQPPPDDLR